MNSCAATLDYPSRTRATTGGKEPAIPCCSNFCECGYSSTCPANSQNHDQRQTSSSPRDDDILTFCVEAGGIKHADVREIASSDDSTTVTAPFLRLFPYLRPPRMRMRLASPHTVQREVQRRFRGLAILPVFRCRTCIPLRPGGRVPLSTHCLFTVLFIITRRVVVVETG